MCRRGSLSGDGFGLSLWNRNDPERFCRINISRKFWYGWSWYVGDAAGLLSEPHLISPPVAFTIRSFGFAVGLLAFKAAASSTCARRRFISAALGLLRG